MAKKIPGKSEFYETLRYFDFMLKQQNVHVYLNKEADEEVLSTFEHVIIATGVNPRSWDIPGANASEVVSYIDVLKGNVKVGKRVAIIGAGGIGFDVAEFLIHDDSDNFFK